MDWTAESDASWITLIPDKDGGIVTVAISDMGIYGSRNGTVTVTNGKNTATLTVNQMNLSCPPVLSFRNEELSTDPNHPTEIPAGSFVVSIAKMDANAVYMQLARKENNNYFQ